MTLRFPSRYQKSLDRRVIEAIETGNQSGRVSSFTPVLAFVDECVASIRVSNGDWTLDQAAEMLAQVVRSGDYSISDLVGLFSISRSTVYRTLGSQAPAPAAKAA